MIGDRTRWLAFGSVAVSVIMFGAGMTLFFSRRLTGDLSDDLPFAVVLLLWAGIGSVLAVRAPSNPIGWLFCGMGVISEALFLARMYGAIEGALGARYAAWVESWAADGISPVLVMLLLLLFPTGRFATNVERFAAAAMFVLSVATMAATALRPGTLDGYSRTNPFGVEALDHASSAVVTASGPLLTVLFVVAIVSMFRRFRRARGVERQQVKWFFFAAALMTLAIVCGGVAAAVGADEGIGDFVGGAIFLIGLGGLAVGIALAILRYRLYDIDVFINRALVYGSLTALLVLGYLGLVVALQVVLDPVTRDSDLAVAASTLGVAGVFRPLRSRLQAFIDRRFYRRKYDLSQTLVSFGRRLRDEVDLEVVHQDVVRVVSDTIQPSHVSLWIKQGAA